MKSSVSALLPMLASPVLGMLLLGAGADVRAAERLVVHAGHLLDVDSGRMLSDQAVRIEDGRIQSIAPWSAAAAGTARQLDWSAYTVVPGLMDMHTHISEPN